MTTPRTATSAAENSWQETIKLDDLPLLQHIITLVLEDPRHPLVSICSRLAAVNKVFRSCVHQSLQELPELNLDCRSYNFSSFSKGQVGASFPHILKRCKTLKRLVLNGRTELMSKSTLSCAAGPHLEELSIQYFPRSPETANLYEEATKPTMSGVTLAVMKAFLTDPLPLDIELGRFQNLRKLDISHCSEVFTFSLLSNLFHLEVLIANWCDMRIHTGASYPPMNSETYVPPIQPFVSLKRLEVRGATCFLEHYLTGFLFWLMRHSRIEVLDIAFAELEARSLREFFSFHCKSRDSTAERFPATLKKLVVAEKGCNNWATYGMEPSDLDSIAIWVKECSKGRNLEVLQVTA